MLRQLSAAACRASGLGRPLLAASSPSSGALWLRSYSDAPPADGEKPAVAAAPAEQAAAEAAGGSGGGEQAAAAAAAPPPPPPPPPAALVDEDGTVLPPELFSKRQLARMGLGDPAKYRHFLPRLSRAEAGSFADEYVAEEFDIESELYPSVPEDEPLYDLRQVVPEIYQPRSEAFERLQRLRARTPDMPLDRWLSEVAGIDAPEEEPPHPGARRYIRWEIRHVYSVGVQESHPVNKRVKAWVHLRDLQREHGLTDAALQHIAAVCGQRYNPGTGELKLVADRYPHREANRAHIRQIIDDLVAEGHRKHPAQQQQQQQQPDQQRQQQAAAGAAGA